MTTYVLHRMFQAALVLLGTTLILFGCLFMAGDPFASIGGKRLSDNDRKSLRAEYRLDKPLREQYVHYVGQLARGDMGRSYNANETGIHA